MIGLSGWKRGRGDGVEAKMQERFTAPRRAVLASAVRWNVWRVWAAVRQSARWFADNGAEIIGELVAAGCLMLVFLLLPIMAALIGG